MSANALHMTSIRGLGPLPDLVEARLGPDGVRRLFDGSGLEPDIAARPGAMVPLRDMVGLFDRAARLTGDGLIGLRVGQQMPGGFGPWTRLVRAAPTLRHSLNRIRRGLAYHQSGGRLALDRAGPMARLSYHVPVAAPERRAQHVEHTLPALFDMFGLYLGPGWRPARIEVDYPSHPRLAALEDALQVPVIAGSAAPGLVFAAGALDAPRLAPADTPVLSRDELRAILRDRPPRTLSETVRHLAEARLFLGACDLPSVAGQMHMTPRTLQRRLRAEGHSFTDLVDGLRLDRARRLLTGSALPVTEIAYQLGYSDTAHFSRAFRRLTGCSPSAYRLAGRA
ncbi:AraC family transcriptional regulator ligand-binding domain-containing protein [Marinibacterium sp. SX1]|uniref:AraC family transcriptional regulator n=1 Tax=Marinibacterium sp. SX1 TaxID=3388424 RepID=UPI003D174F44